MNKIRISEVFNDDRRVCYDINIEFELKLTGMKFSRDELETEAEMCGDVSLKLWAYMPTSYFELVLELRSALIG